MPEWIFQGEWGLQHPFALIAITLAVWAAVRLLRRSPERLGWPGLPEAESARGRVVDLDRWLRAGLRGLAIAALTVALAGPVQRRLAAPPPELGLDLVLVVDASGSMQALDAELDGEWRTRLDLARQVVSRFAEQRAAHGDRVGLVVFGEHAFTQCPLTRDGALLSASLQRVRPGVAGENTALGDALALAVKRVSVRTDADARADTKVGSRVVILLTDGRSNAGEIPVDVAAELARARGVRVHTVGIGGEGPVAIDASGGSAGRGLTFARHDLDADALAWIADHTGGRFFPALRPADLASVYETIDSLERTERPAEGRRIESSHPEPWLAAGGGLVALELLVFSILRRPLP